MQTSTTTNIRKEHISFELSVLLMGHNHDEARSVEHFYEASECISSCNKNIMKVTMTAILSFQVETI